MSKSLKTRATLARIRASAVAKALSVMAADPRFQKGPQHIRARAFSMIDPAGDRHDIVNLSDFVRTRRELFAASDVAHDNPRKTRAYAGLYSMFRERDRRPGWKGWMPS